MYHKIPFIFFAFFLVSCFAINENLIERELKGPSLIFHDDNGPRYINVIIPEKPDTSEKAPPSSYLLIYDPESNSAKAVNPLTLLQKSRLDVFQIILSNPFFYSLTQVKKPSSYLLFYDTKTKSIKLEETVVFFRKFLNEKNKIEKIDPKDFFIPLTELEPIYLLVFDTKTKSVRAEKFDKITKDFEIHKAPHGAYRMGDSNVPTPPGWILKYHVENPDDPETGLCAMSLSEGKITKFYALEEAYSKTRPKKLSPYVRYSIRGTILVKGYKYKGKKQGRWVYYYESGKIRTIGYFDQDEPIGEWEYYDVEGQRIHNLELYKDTCK